MIGDGSDHGDDDGGDEKELSNCSWYISNQPFDAWTRYPNLDALNSLLGLEGAKLRFHLFLSRLFSACILKGC